MPDTKTKPVHIVHTDGTEEVVSLEEATRKKFKPNANTAEAALPMTVEAGATCTWTGTEWVCPPPRGEFGEEMERPQPIRVIHTDGTEEVVPYTEAKRKNFKPDKNGAAEFALPADVQAGATCTWSGTQWVCPPPRTLPGEEQA